MVSMPSFLSLGRNRGGVTRATGEEILISGIFNLFQNRDFRD